MKIFLVLLFSVMFLASLTLAEAVEKEEMGPLEKWKASLVITGPLHVETQKRLEAEKIQLDKEELQLQEIQDRLTSKSNYILSDREIKILVSNSKKISYNQSFDFDIRIVDPDVNISRSFWEDKGYINDVEIVSIVRDPTGNILNQFTGNTTDKGTFSPEIVTSFDYQTFYQSSSYTLNVTAIKYFDDDGTYATSSILEEFFVYAPSKGSAKTTKIT